MKKIYLNTLTPEETIKRLKDGEVIWHTNNVFSYKFVDGVLCSFRQNKILTINCGFNAQLDNAYFEEKEEFKIGNVGKFKTRDGRVAFVSYIYNDNDNGYFCTGIIAGDKETTEWGLTGKLLGTLKNISDEDLVEYVGD